MDFINKQVDGTLTDAELRIASLIKKAEDARVTEKKKKGFFKRIFG